MKTPAGTGPTRVLVADDNVVVRRLLVVRLRAAGCRVTEATDGLDALEQFRKEPVQVVITDLSMPHMNGLELLAALRAHAAPPEVILLTGSRASDAEAAVQALRLGAHDYICKTPAAVEAVALAVERAAEKWRLREENARLVAELRRMSLSDALTGAGNRRAFDEALRLEIARARRQRSGLALVLLDLDHFKRINDTLGTWPATGCWPRSRKGCDRSPVTRTACSATAARSSRFSSPRGASARRSRPRSGWCGRRPLRRSRRAPPRRRHVQRQRLGAGSRRRGLRERSRGARGCRALRGQAGRPQPGRGLRRPGAGGGAPANMALQARAC